MLLRSISSGGEGERKKSEAKLLEAYQPLIRAEVARLARPAMANYEDLMQQGGLGLLEAARRFDLSRDVGLGSYARSAILGAIKRAFGPADQELSGLAVEELEDAPVDEDATGQDGLGPAKPRTDRVHLTSSWGSSWAARPAAATPT